MSNFSKYSDVKSVLVFDGGQSADATLTFLIPTCGRYDTLFRTLESIHVQRKNVIEYNILIIDNNSSMVFGSDFFNKLKPFHNIRYYVNEKNIGMFGNWNRGICLANTQFISMIHDDDTICEDYLIRIAKILKKKRNKKIVYIKATSDDVEEETGRTLHKDRLFKILLKSIFSNKIVKISSKLADYIGDLGFASAPSCGSVFFKEAIVELGGFDESFYPSSDTVMLIEALGKYSIYKSFGILGHRYFGRNESCKFETMNLWVTNFLKTQQMLALRSKHGQKTVEKYKNEQIAMYINNLKLLPEKEGRRVSIDDFDAVKGIHFSKRRLFFLRQIIRIHFAVASVKSFFM